jgi:hypothetical protein
MRWPWVSYTKGSTLFSAVTVSKTDVSDGPASSPQAHLAIKILDHMAIKVTVIDRLV